MGGGGGEGVEGRVCVPNSSFFSNARYMIKPLFLKRKNMNALFSDLGI